MSTVNAGMSHGFPWLPLPNNMLQNPLRIHRILLELEAQADPLTLIFAKSQN
jgi:hypothetical protein